MTRGGGLAALLFATLAMFAPSVARAGDIEDFQAAYALYEAHDWPRAIAAFEALIGGESPTLESQPLVLESRKYLAAAYVFVGREEAAAAQLERLLRDEPTYELDATQFPREVVQLFERVRARLAERRSMEAARAALEAEIERLRGENASLRTELEGERTIEVPRSQWLMQIPFGVGQFENGEEGLGWFFLVTEALAAGGFATALSLHLGYAAQLSDLERYGRDRDRIDRVNAALQITNAVNWSSGALLLGLAAAGLIQANIAFTPSRVVRVPGRGEPGPALSLRLGPGLVGVAGSF